MPSKVAKDRTKLFIKKYGADIAKAIEGTGLYFAAVVGQKCNESGYGSSNLAVNYNNFGGIKNFGSLSGASGRTSNGWAIFATPYDCFKVYVSQLKSPTKKYVKEGVFTASSPEEQIKAMVRAGYCAGVTPEQYLNVCRSALDSAREIMPLTGKVDNATALIAQIKQATV